MGSVKIVHAEKNLTIGIDGVWVYVNDRKWGFVSNGGLYCHRNGPEKFRKEYGFHIPKYLLTYPIFFEAKMAKDKRVTWHYDPSTGHRMLITDPLIFVSLARLTLLPEAPHVPRPRPQTKACLPTAGGSGSGS